jgi:hypothetical protein
MRPSILNQLSRFSSARSAHPAAPVVEQCVLSIFDVQPAFLSNLKVWGAHAPYRFRRPHVDQTSSQAAEALH